MIAAEAANIGVVFGPMDCKRLCFKGGGFFPIGAIDDIVIILLIFL
jgi:hypothetical protein